MDKNDHLVSVRTNMLKYFGISYIVHRLKLLDGLLFRDADELLAKRARTV